MTRAAPPSLCIVPGEHVAIHWIALPPLTQAQARAAARLAVADLCAAPMDTLHVAVGERDDEGRYPVAVIDRGLMAALVADDPDHAVPEPLLLPDDGWVRLDRGDHVLLRGPGIAATVSPEVASLLVQGTVRDVTDLEPGVPLDLRQGEFARGWRWPRVTRRAAVLGALCVALLAANVAVPVLRAHLQAAQLRREAAEIGRELAALRGAEPAVAALFAAVRSTPEVELTALDFSDGLLRADIAGDGEGLVRAIEARGFVALAQGRSRIEITPDNARVAERRAERDALRVRVFAPLPKPLGAFLRASAEEAGFSAVAIEASPPRARIAIPAVRAQAFFPWLDRISTRYGLVVERISATPNSDRTLSIGATFKTVPKRNNS